MRKTLIFCMIIFCLPLAAMARDYPRAEFFGGFSIYSGSPAIGDYDDIASMLGTDNGQIPTGWRLDGNILRTDDREQFYGIQANVAGNFRENFGIVADFGCQSNDLNGHGFLVYEYLFGPQFSRRGDKATLFAHALFGGNGFHSSGSTNLFDSGISRYFSENAFAMGFGGGVDLNAGNRFAIRVVQLDWIPNRMGGEWSTSEFRLGFGIVFKAGN